MLKLMKYELIKQRFSKILMLAMIVILQIAFAIALILDKNDALGVIAAFASMLAVGALPFIAFESILTYSNDLRTKTSYMLFLTPRTMHQIVGAKLLAAAVQVVLSGFAFLGIFTANFLVLVAKYESIYELKIAMQHFLLNVFSVDIDYLSIVSVLCTVITFWLLILSLGFLSITLSTTLLANSKWKGVVSVGVFILIINIIFQVIDRIHEVLNVNQVAQSNLTTSSVLLVFIILFYISMTWMLEKKVSV